MIVFSTTSTDVSYWGSDFTTSSVLFHPLNIILSAHVIVSPGSTVGSTTKEESISHIAQCINKAHRETKFVITVIENMVRSITACYFITLMVFN